MPRTYPDSVTSPQPTLHWVRELKYHLDQEIMQKKYEGHDTLALEKAFHELPKDVEVEHLPKVEDLWQRTEKLPEPVGFPYVEPSDLEGIKSERPDGPRKVKAALGEDAVYQKALGAWLGRCAGCLLGKPVEGWHKNDIEKTLKAIGEFPLADYWPELPEDGLDYRRYHPEVQKHWLRGNFDHCIRDDDTDYTAVNLLVAEAHGLHFAPENVLGAWLRQLPFGRVCTAENAAYRNYINGFVVPETATYRNPFREWIGAQIRADLWGYVAPGNMELAAELAWRDACVSHTRNGIYGEMFFAALLAACYVETDLNRAIEAALAEIPENCRFSECVRETMAWCEADGDWQATWERINEKYGHLSAVHVLNNAALVVLALFHGQRDFTETIGIAVMGGWDTDCNGATAGSVLGMMLGAEGIPAKWTEGFHDTLHTSLVDMGMAKISDLAERTARIATQSLSA